MIKAASAHGALAGSIFLIGCRSLIIHRVEISVVDGKPERELCRWQHLIASIDFNLTD
jgi:hypothetical protein